MRPTTIIDTVRSIVRASLCCSFYTASAPAETKKPKRHPYTPAFLAAIRDHLNLNKPLDAAVFACLTTTFYSIARLGEFTVSAIKDFDPKKHITRANISDATDHNGLMVTKLHLPRTQCSPIEGEDTYWAVQVGPTNPKEALENHLRVNATTNPRQTHLFTWKHARGMRPMSKKQLLKRVASAAASAGLPDLKGHGLRIRGTLEYLLRGLPFKIVKTMGRWSSDAFESYLREHATVLAPYIQASPALETFMRHTMPPIR
jgi:hypothetical protein